jgi:hypothetical protein
MAYLYSLMVVWVVLHVFGLLIHQRRGDRALALYPRGQSHKYQLNKRLVGSSSYAGLCGVKKYSSPYRETNLSRRPVATCC